MHSVRVRRLVVQVGAGVFLFAAIELVTRELVPPPSFDRYRLARVAGADGISMMGSSQQVGAFLDDAQALLQPDPRLLWRLRPDLDLQADSLSLGQSRSWRVRTSGDGFRDRPLADRPEGETRVLAVGDSSTFGWGVADDEPWPAALETELGEGWQVLNLGVPGYSSVQGRTLVEELAPGLTPDALVVAMGANDGHLVLRSDLDALHARDTMVGQARHAAGRLRLVQLGRQALFGLWTDGLALSWRLGATRPRVDPTEFEEALEDLAGHAPRTILVDLCARREYGRVMLELARSRVDVIMVRYDRVHGETLDGCHPTPAGHRALAGELAGYLENRP